MKAGGTDVVVGFRGKGTIQGGQGVMGEGVLGPNANYWPYNWTEFSLPFGFPGHWNGSYAYPRSRKRLTRDRASSLAGEGSGQCVSARVGGMGR